METYPDELGFDDTSEEDGTLVVRVGWVHIATVAVVLIGLAGALMAGLWLGGIVSVPSAASPATAAQLSSSPSTGQIQIRPAQPQVFPAQSAPQAQPAQSRSSAGVTTTIGRTPSVGDEAPDFTLKNLDGDKVSLSDYEGQPVLINFWATWCGPCRLEMPIIEDMYQKYQDEGFVVLAVDVEESITVVNSFVKSMGLTFPVVLDYNGDVADGPYRLRAYPTSYFIGRDGKVTAFHRGMMTEPIIERYMEQVLATEPAQ